MRGVLHGRCQLDGVDEAGFDPGLHQDVRGAFDLAGEEGEDALVGRLEQGLGPAGHLAVPGLDGHGHDVEVAARLVFDDAVSALPAGELVQGAGAVRTQCRVRSPVIHEQFGVGEQGVARCVVGGQARRHRA